jgi:hypothetical protein
MSMIMLIDDLVVCCVSDLMFADTLPKQSWDATSSKALKHQEQPSTFASEFAEFVYSLCHVIIVVNAFALLSRIDLLD